MNDVTRILGSLERGEPHAAEPPLPFVYDELLRLAAAKIARVPAEVDAFGVGTRSASTRWACLSMSF